MPVGTTPGTDSAGVSAAVITSAATNLLPNSNVGVTMKSPSLNTVRMCLRRESGANSCRVARSRCLDAFSHAQNASHASTHRPDGRELTGPYHNDSAVPFKCRIPQHQRNQHEPQPIHVSGGADGHTRRLGRHPVLALVCRHSIAPPSCSIVHADKAGVGKYWRPTAVDQHIAQLNVPVDVALAVHSHGQRHQARHKLHPLLKWTDVRLGRCSSL